MRSAVVEVTLKIEVGWPLSFVTGGVRAGRALYHFASVFADHEGKSMLVSKQRRRREDRAKRAKRRTYPFDSSQHPPPPPRPPTTSPGILLRVLMLQFIFGNQCVISCRAFELSKLWYFVVVSCLYVSLCLAWPVSHKLSPLHNGDLIIGREHSLT
jgi:hypothetical protein